MTLVASGAAHLLRLVCLLTASLVLLSPAQAGGLTPKSVPVQMRLAEEMAANEDWDEAARRWIQILYYFGPSDHEARAEFELGAVALHRGRSDLAISHWERAARRDPETEWAQRAREGLRLLGKDEPAPLAEPPEPYITADTPSDGRQFLAAEGDAAAGLLRFAIRDFLKISNLYPDSERAPEARFRIGTCQALLGRPELAVQQWDRLIQDYPDSRQAQMARAGSAAWRAALEVAGTDVPGQREPIPEGEWRPFRRYATEADRGLSYAEDLFENGILDYALQEYAKVLCGVYAAKGEGSPHRAYARYRMGVCAYRLGQRDAASRQWRRLLADRPGSLWAQRADSALAAVGGTDPVPSDADQLAPPVPDDLPTPLVQRHHLAEQLLACGLPLIAAKEYLKVMFVLTAGRPNPLQAEACYKLGLCQHLRGRPGLARTVWERTVAEYPDTVWAEKADAALSRAARQETALAGSLTEPTL